MNITLIGSGNVATILGKRYLASGQTILQVMSPRPGKAAALAAELGAEPIWHYQHLKPGADLYLIAATDTAIYELASVLRLGNALVAHTAGSVPLSVLSPVSKSHGVLYPLQSLHKEVQPPSRIPLLVDGVNEATLSALKFAAGFISDTVQTCHDAERQSLHLGGVLVNNFPNYLYTLTAEFLSQRGADFKLLLPLIEETANRLEAFAPAAVQTGPAIRRDKGTIERHEALLEGNAELQQWYRLFSERIMERYEEGA